MSQLGHCLDLIVCALPCHRARQAASVGVASVVIAVAALGGGLWYIFRGQETRPRDETDETYAFGDLRRVSVQLQPADSAKLAAAAAEAAAEAEAEAETTAAKEAAGAEAGDADNALPAAPRFLKRAHSVRAPTFRSYISYSALVYLLHPAPTPRSYIPLLQYIPPAFPHSYIEACIPTF